MHSELPLSSFELKNVKDPTIRAFYEETLEHLDAASLMFDMLREYWLMGEVFAFLTWSDKFGTFTKAELLIPERVKITTTPFSEENDPYIYEYLMDMEVLKHVSNLDLKQLPAEISIALQEGRNLRLSSQNLLTMMRKSCPYDERGTSVILRVFRELIYESKIMEAMYAVADRWISPKEIWKIGDANFIPDQQQLNDFRQMLLDAENQPQFTLVTHGLVSVDIVGAAGKWPNLQSEYEWVEKRVLAGLFLNKALIHGEGPTYATANVGYRALMSRYLAVRAKLERAWKEKVFLPIALANQFYETEASELSHKIRKPYAERIPCIPDFEWRHKADLLDDQSYRNLLLQLRSRGELPLEVIVDAIGYDPEYIKDGLEKEVGTILDPAFREFQRRLMEENIKGIPKPASVSKGGLDSAVYKDVMKMNTEEFFKNASSVIGAGKVEEYIKEVDSVIPDDAKFCLPTRGLHGKAEAVKEATKVRNPYILRIAAELGEDRLRSVLGKSDVYSRILDALGRDPITEHQELHGKFVSKEKRKGEKKK